MNKKVLSLCLLLILWQILALITAREVILPYPIEVFNRIYELLLSSEFYTTVLTTLLRANIGFMIALLSGISIGFLAYFHTSVESFLSPILSLLQTIPQISYMIILIVWFEQTTCIMIIILLMTFPIVYHNVLTGLKHIDDSLMDVIHLYHHPMFFMIRHVYLPLIRPYIESAIDTILPFCLKVCVMAEVLIQAQKGIGAKLYFSRLNIDMTGVFAWTICLVLLLVIETKLVDKIMKHHKKKRLFTSKSK